MKVFVTGATGFIGSALIAELEAAGHGVVGLARGDAAAAKLESLGVAVHRGTLEEPESLARGARNADGVVHLAFDHDFSRFVENGRKDNRAVETMLAVLEGTGKPFLVTSGVNIVTGKIAEETDPTPREGFGVVRGASELATLGAAERGVRAMVVRLPQVHDTRRQGLITPMIQIARQKGFVGYAGDGANGFSAAHVSDVATLYRLALEKGRAGAVFHAVDEEHVPMRAMAEAIGERLGLPARGLEPEEIADYFGPFAMSPAWTITPPASSRARPWAGRRPGAGCWTTCARANPTRRFEAGSRPASDQRIPISAKSSTMWDRPARAAAVSRALSAWRPSRASASARP